MGRLQSYIFIIVIGIVLTFTMHVYSKKTSNSYARECDSKNYILISTLDGFITALDLNSGRKCWSTLLDTEKFISSNLSKLEVFENGSKIYLVPSLDGTLYKYDPKKYIIAPLELDAETLISHSEYIDSSSVINGGKIKIIHGIHRLTGEVIYTCNANGCIKFKADFPLNLLIIEEFIQVVNAIDISTAEKRWHFRVVELKIQASYNDSSTFSEMNDERALISHMPPKVSDFINTDVYKISLKNGILGKISKTKNEFSWTFKAQSPISDVWVLTDDLIEILDPFDKETGFYSIDIDDGHFTSLLFLGTFEEQIFIKKSRKLMPKYPYTTISQKFVHHTVKPVSNRKTTLSPIYLFPHDGANFTRHIDDDDFFSDYGLYFSANISIAENATHCILNYTDFTALEDEFSVQIGFAVGITIGVFFGICIFYICSREEQHKKIGTTQVKRKMCSVAVSSITVSSNEEFTSRFHQDFELISILGKGGFGIVMDAKNKLDDCHYAIKRICLHEEINSAQYEKVLREVKALAKLEHHGIVRYFNAWFEYPPAGWQENKDKEANICESSSEDDYEKSDVLMSKKKNLTVHKFSKHQSPKYAIFEKLNRNPFQLSSDHLFSDASFKKSKLSAYSSSDINEDSSTSSEEHSGHSIINKSDSHSDDSFIQFTNEISDNNCESVGIENDDLNITRERNKITEKSSTCEENYTTKFSKSSVPKKNLLCTEIEKHTKCYENLIMINDSLIYALMLEELNSFTPFIFCDKTLIESDTDVVNLKNTVSTFTKDKLAYYQKWLICTLCKIRFSETFTCTVATVNLSYILFDINDQLYKGKFLLNVTHAESLKEPVVQSSHSHKKIKNERSLSSIKGKCTTKGSTSHSIKASVKDLARGYLYIQMQLCQKHSLRDWLTEHCDSRDYAKVLEIFSEIVDAVHYVHNCGLMHRDLKPSNIYFSKEGAIKIGDFGLATSSEIKVENGSNDQPSDIHTSDIGTELYMSPEQKLKKDYDSKTDIFSLGIIFFELLVPFKTNLERCKVLLQVRKSEFPEKFEKNFQDECQLVKLLLRKEPKERPTTSEIKQHPVLEKFMSTLK